MQSAFFAHLNCDFPSSCKHLEVLFISLMIKTFQWFSIVLRIDFQVLVIVYITLHSFVRKDPIILKVHGKATTSCFWPLDLYFSIWKMFLTLFLMHVSILNFQKKQHRMHCPFSSLSGYSYYLKNISESVFHLKMEMIIAPIS